MEKVITDYSFSIASSGDPIADSDKFASLKEPLEALRQALSEVGIELHTAQRVTRNQKPRTNGAGVAKRSPAAAVSTHPQ